MLWILAGILFGIAVGALLLCACRDRRDFRALTVQTETDWDRRQREASEAILAAIQNSKSKIENPPERFSLDATPHMAYGKFGPTLVYRFEVNYRAESGETFVLRFLSNENPNVVRGHIADLAADPDLAFDEEDRRLLADVFLTRAFQKFYDKLQLHPLAGQKITFSKSTTNHTNGDAA